MGDEIERPSLKRFIFGKINRKLIINFLLIGLVPILILGLLSINIMKNGLQNEISSKVLNLGEAKEAQVFAYLDSIESRTIDFASEGFIKNNLEKINKGEDVPETTEILNNYLIINKKSLDATIGGIFIMDLNGKIVASTHNEEMGKDESKDDYFIEGSKKVFTTELRGHKHFGLTNPLIVTTPLIDLETGEFLGVIANIFDSRKIQEILSGQFQIEKGAISGQRGKTKTLETYLVNRNKEMFVLPKSLEGQKYNEDFGGMIVDTLPVQKCIEESKEIVDVYDNFRSEEVIGASMCISKQEWVLLVEVHTEEAFIPIKTMFFIFGSILGFFLLFAIFSGFISAKRISRPIEKIYRATEELEKGNFDIKTNIKTGDELEKLGEVFNKTARVFKQRDEEHKQLEHAKTEFLSITSHELRSPMTPMKAQLQMLMGEYFGKLNDKQKKSLDIVLRNTTRLDNIIVDFLEISRIEAARLKFNFIKTNLTEHINRLVEEMKGFMPEKNIEVVAKIDKLPVIEADPDRVMQVLRNLINNAKKFSPDNSKIFVNVKLQENMILFSVKDQGIGIKPENQKRIFEPFFQAEQTMYRKSGGTGLGLAIIKGIVESQEGKVWIESEKGKGTTFYFTVPLKPVREIKPIKILFSPQANVEKKIEPIFIELLGLMGKHEFENLKERNQINQKALILYIDELYNKGIFTKEKAEIFKGKIFNIFGEKPRTGVGAKELFKKGLIKRKVEKTIAEKLIEKGLVKGKKEDKK